MASMESKYNLKSPGVKRLMREACELAEPTDEYFACPLEDNLFEWHFTVQGPPNTEFEGGYYHGRILLPSQYPMQPPNIILLTPNGRFEVNKKICLSISGHHPESWQPSWSIRTALLALIAFMPTPAAGTIGSLDYTPDERRVLARKSKNWECDVCGRISLSLSKQTNKQAPLLTEEESSFIQHIALKAEDDPSKKQETSPPGDSSKVSSDVQQDVKIDEESSIRQRISPTNDVDTANAEFVTTTSNSNVNLVESQVGVPGGNVDKWMGAAVWVIVSVIVLLILRRIFFL